MTTNWMFSLHIDNTSQMCFSAKVKDETWLWNFWYGHLNFGGLKELQENEMVKRLRKIVAPYQVFQECVIASNTQISFHKTSLRGIKGCRSLCILICVGQSLQSLMKVNSILYRSLMISI